MRIAQVSPLAESVPPKAYGGTERVVSNLTEQLVAIGHDVTLFASGDSRTSAELAACCEHSLRLNTATRSHQNWLIPHLCMLEWVAQRADEFDLIHYHLDYLHYSLSRRSATPHLTTMHGRLDLPELVPLFREFDDLPLVSISNAQRAPLPWANWAGTVLHGIPLDAYHLQPEPGTYLAFIGRTSPEKGLERAVEIARAAGVELRIAAKVDAVDRDYFDHSIAPLLQQPGIEFVGELDEADKQAFLGQAMALMFQVDWPEPFGLAMIEAMACGTPVIARRRGSVPEVVDENVTGFIVETVDEGVAAVEKVRLLDRSACRARFEQRFSAQRMAHEYIEIYKRVMRREPVPRTASVVR